MAKRNTSDPREAGSTLSGGKVTCRNIRWQKPAKKRGKIVCPECGRPAVKVAGLYGDVYEHKDE